MQTLKTRMNRASYWLCVAIVGILYFVISLFAKKPPAIAEIVLIFLCVPRLHDIGMSGWWAGGAIALEIAVVAASLIFLPLDQALIPMGLYVLLVAGAMIWLGLRPGDSSANRYGEPPLPGLSVRRRAPAAPAQ